MQSDFDKDLLNYFTDVEQLRAIFREYVSTPKLPRRLIVLHGVGGVGKSSLLRMFRLYCKNEKIPVALTSGDDAKSVLDVVTHWSEDLKAEGIKFSLLHKTLESYHGIQVKVADQAQKSHSRVLDIASKAAAKTAETAGGTLVGAAIGSVIPGVGTAIGGALGGMLSGLSTEALIDWLRGFLSKLDIDLLLDPSKKLSADFLEDITKAAEKKRIVLLLDTFEQMPTLEDWIGEVAQKIHPNILMVIAGRKLPDWNRVWPGWMMNAQVEELKPMNEAIMRQLIQRYYATMRGGEADPTQVEAIVHFASGLPLVVISAVQLWVKYGVEDFQSVKAEIFANLVDRLMEGVPDALIPALEAAAVVRWFDQPILRAIMKQEDVRDVYNELRRFPFVRARVEGLALHDSVREMMNENLRVQDSERHAELHERAALYFEKRLEKATGAEAERLGLEKIYHRVRADEETGIKLFQDTAEHLTRLRLVSQLRMLLNDVNSYALNSVNSNLWRDYYNASLAFFERRYIDAEKLYESLAKNDQCEPQLKAYAFCEWGTILRKSEFYGQSGGAQKARDVIETSVQTATTDIKLITAYGNLREVYLRSGEWDRAVTIIQDLLNRFEQTANQIGTIEALMLAKGNYARIGDWQKAVQSTKAALALLKNLPEISFLKVNLLCETPWAYIWAGMYKEVEKDLRECLGYVEQTEDLDRTGTILGLLGFVLGLQNRFLEAQSAFEESLNISRHPGALGYQGAIFTRSGDLDRAVAVLQESLAIKKERSNIHGILELYNWLGELSEVRKQFDSAIGYYTECMSLSSVGRQNFISGALLGLIRANCALGQYTNLQPLLVESGKLARQYEYSDHLAALNLSLGHLAWSSHNPKGYDNGPEAALRYYQQALSYALKYNRFVLDEILWGGGIAIPLEPIIPFCLQQGEEGKEMLQSLSAWWESDQNIIETSYSGTLSCVKTELSAREREPGDRTKQMSVTERINTATNELH
jgi:tetratricopeptide (TPR) repeat protein